MSKRKQLKNWNKTKNKVIETPLVMFRRWLTKEKLLKIYKAKKIISTACFIYLLQEENDKLKSVLKFVVDEENFLEE